MKISFVEGFSEAASPLPFEGANPYEPPGPDYQAWLRGYAFYWKFMGSRFDDSE